MEPEFHIASLIVQALPVDMPAVKNAITLLEGTETHQESPEGKLIVTVEAPHERDVLAKIQEIQAIDGTLSAVMVYHQVDKPTSNATLQDQAGDMQ